MHSAFSNQLSAFFPSCFYESGINIDNSNDNGATALMYASSTGKVDIVKILLNQGADTRLATDDGFSALDLASSLPVLKLLRGHEDSTIETA